MSNPYHYRYVSLFELHTSRLHVGATVAEANNRSSHSRNVPSDDTEYGPMFNASPIDPSIIIQGFQLSAMRHKGRNQCSHVVLAMKAVIEQAQNSLYAGDRTGIVICPRTRWLLS
jgi:hypothetical protein